MTLLDTDKIDERMKNSGIKKIWGETKHADPLKCNINIPGNFQKSLTWLQPLVIQSIIQVLQGIPSDIFIFNEKAPEVIYIEFIREYSLRNKGDSPQVEFTLNPGIFIFIFKN